MIYCNTIYIFVFEESLGIDALEMLNILLTNVVTCSVLNKDNLLHYVVLLFYVTHAKNECVLK